MKRLSTNREKVGDKFGSLTLISKAKGPRPGLFWLCRCACDTQKVIFAGHLRSGGTTSCGCRRWPKEDRLPLTQAHLKKLLSYDKTSGTFTWSVNKRGGVRIGDIAGATKEKSDGSKYREIMIGRHAYQAHRLAVLYVTGERPQDKVDHQDRNGLNNSWLNLRCATNSQNAANAKIYSTNTSGFKGVTWNKGCRRWQAAIKVKGKNLYLGLFDDPREAHRAYMDAARKHFGEFARAA